MGDIGKAGGITGAVFGGANALMKLGLGIKQLIDGKKIQKKLDAQGRPLETTPEAFNETEALVRSNYLNGKLAGQTQLTDQITSQGANQIQNIQQTAGSGADALMAYNVANNNTQRNLNELGIKAAQNQQNNFQQLLNALGQKAAFQQSQFQNNVMTPYMQQAQQAQALKQGGLNNQSNAFNDVGNLGMGVALLNPSGGGNQDDDMKQIQALLLSLQNKGNGTQRATQGVVKDRRTPNRNSG